MDSYMNAPTDFMWDYAGRLEGLYPESYKRIYPHVQYAVDALGDELMYNTTDEDIDKLTDDVIRVGNMHADPAFGRGLRDLTKFLIVRALYDRHRRFGRGRYPVTPYDRYGRYEDHRRREAHGHY